MVMKLSSITNAAAKNYQANFKGREESSLPSDENRKGSLNKWLIAGAAIAAITLGGLYFMKSKDPKAAENTAGRLKENLQGALDGAKEKTAGGFPKNPEYMSDLKSNIEKLAQNNGETLSLEGMSKHQLKAARRSLAKKTAGKSSAVPKSPDIQKREQEKGKA